MGAAEMEEVTEGTTRFLVPRSAHKKGPKAIEGVPFYNPEMRLARDVSVSVLATWASGRPRPVRVCDAMSSLGARGLRFASEVPGVHVVLNDANPSSALLASENATRLALPNVEVRRARLQALLEAERFDWVDIDPFGTPEPFLDSALTGVAKGGLLAVTATDKAALCGVYPEVCQERYGATPLHGPMMWEIATRILVGAISRLAEQRGRTLRPLLAHSTSHYVRCYLELDAPRPPPVLGYAWVREDLSRGTSASPVDGAVNGGPLWVGKISDRDFLRRMMRDAPPHGSLAQRRLAILVAEADAPPLYYSIDEFTRSLKVNAPPMATLLSRLHSQGRVATRTHFTPRGFKTDASVDEIVAALRGA